MGFFLFCFTVISLRLIDLGVNSERKHTKIKNNSSAIKTNSSGIKVSRKDITDRYGVIIATNIASYSFFANPQKILDAKKAAMAVIKIFPDLKKQEVLEKLSQKNTSFVWLKRRITPNKIKDIDKIGEPGLSYKQEDIRIYPHGNLFSHLLGFTNIDGNGIAGLEKAYDDFLKNQDEENLRLTLDTRIQEVLHQELQEGLIKYKASGAAGIILDIENNDVIASVSLPDFNPNEFAKARENSLFNIITSSVYEMGSTIKALTFANAYEEKKIKNTELIDVSKPIRVGRFLINDHKPRTEPITPEEAFEISSNIATIKIANRIDIDTKYEFLKKFGLFDAVITELPERAKPIPPRPWDENKAVSSSFGYGFAVTPIHIITAITAIINDGIYQVPNFVLSPKSQNATTRLISSQTSTQMRKLMRKVIEVGTGKEADIKGITIIGKTGTAEKIVDGKYNRKKMISSFYSAFPMERPKYAIFVLLDEPQGIKETFLLATASMNAVPITKKIIQKIYPILGFSPDKE
jgi:cell division protein FtsI (penicillin-binding protein 3)